MMTDDAQFSAMYNRIIAVENHVNPGKCLKKCLKNASWKAYSSVEITGKARGAKIGGHRTGVRGRVKGHNDYCVLPSLQIELPTGRHKYTQLVCL